MHRRNDLLLELIDAHSKRSRDVFDPTRQRRIDLSGDIRQRLRQFFCAPLQSLPDFRRFGAHSIRDLASAIPESFRGFEGATSEGFGERTAALRERIFDPR